MMKMGSTLVALVLLAMTSGCPPQIAPSPDAYVTRRADAFVPVPDVGRPDVGTDAGNDAGNDAGRMLCIAAGPCDPFVARPCPGSDLCVPNTAMGTRCVPRPAGLRVEGARCVASNECAQGLACIDGGAGLACQRLCRIGDNLCGASSVCGVAYDNANPCLRICMPRCDLYEQDCPTGLACVPFRPNPVDDFSIQSCVPEGTTPIGGACTGANSCVRGGICLDSICRQLCNDPSDCTTGACVANSSGITRCE